MADAEVTPDVEIEEPSPDRCAASEVPDDASTAGSRSIRHNPSILLSLWEGHQTASDLQEAIDAQRKEAHKFRLQEKAVLREVKKTKKAQAKIRGKTSKLSTQDLLRELEFRADHKAAVAAAVIADGRSSSSSSGSPVKPPKVSVRRGIF